MTEAAYTKGTFQPFKALAKVHLGALGENLEVGEVVLFDGSVLRRGESDRPFPALRGAIKLGWLVPDTDNHSKYAPKPADIQIGAAVNKSEHRDLRPNKVAISADEQDVGALQQVRGADAPVTHRSKNAGQVNDGVVVAKLKTPAKSGPVEIGMDDRKVVSELDNKSRVALEKIPVAVAGDELAEILPDAAETGKPSPGVAGEGRGDESEMRARAIFASGSSSVGGQEDGVVLRPAFPKSKPDEAPRITASTPVSSLNIEVLQSQVSNLTRKVDAVSAQMTELMRILSANVALPAPQKTLEESPPLPEDFLADILDSNPAPANDAWDMSLHWKARAKKAVDLYADDTDKLNAVLAVEVSSVKAEIAKMLERRSQG
jgi:hypothetical protein